MDTKTILGISIPAGLTMGGAIVAIAKTRFVTRKECKDEQAQCQKTICNKIDNLKEDIGEIKTDLDNMKKSREEEMKNLFEFIGGVKRYMEDHS